MSAKKLFGDLPVGAVFVMDRGKETNLSTLLNEPGNTRYVKIGVRKYQELNHEAISPFRVSSVRIQVWQPRAQPARTARSKG